MDLADQPNSICHVQPIQMYQLPISDRQIEVPFSLLYGEVPVFDSLTVDGPLVLTNYRLFIQLCDTQQHIPLGCIEVVEVRDLFYLHIGCKDARTYRCTFDNNEKCLEWFGRLLKATSPPRQLEELFAFFHFVWSKEHGGEEILSKIDSQKNILIEDPFFKSEVERLKFDLHGVWRISSANKDYKLCSSYPPLLLVPSCITDETLETVAKFRSSRRIPAVVWRHAGNGAVIARCSQPEVGWLGWRSAEDEDLIKAISDACTFDRGPHTMLDKESNLSHSPASVHSEDSTQTQPEIDIREKKKVLIMDARSYPTAVANRARGGGCECAEYYPNCEIQFMSLANIHSIRKSFHALRQLCMSSADQPNWFSQLEGTRWLQNMSGLMKAAVTLVTAVERDARPVLVHCSDGWDRTPQIVALAELLLDPFYRTIDGFRILIEREWLSFGHKFADRCGHATGSEDQNERCPVFLQWLDCVHQLLLQFPCAFQFSHTYLVKLAQHTYSNLFGTFLCNTQQERVEKRVGSHTLSVWGFLSSPCFRNHLYSPANNSTGPQVLWPQYNVRDLYLWSEVYLGSLERQSTPEGSSSTCPGPPECLPQHMTKTRSYGDLLNASDICPNQFRRCSDPSITVDMIKLNSLNISSDVQHANGDEATQENLTKQNTLMNGRNTPTNLTFLSRKMDETGCNDDCIFKNSAQSLDDGVDILTNGNIKGNGVAQNGTSTPRNSDEDETDSIIDDKIVIPNNEKTELDDKELQFDCEIDFPNSFKDVNAFESICLKPKFEEKVTRIPPPTSSDINHNGDLKVDDVDSDTECTEPSESKSENTVCDGGVPIKREIEKSVETSTETLVSDTFKCSASPREINGFEKVSNTDICNGNTDYCKVCAQNIKFINGKHSHHHSGNTSGKTSRYSTPPLYSRTPSANGWDNTLMQLGRQRNTYTYHCTLGDDGLVPLRSDLQDRLWQIIEEHRRKEEALQRELHTYRQALIKQVCHKCNHNEVDRLDETSDSDHSKKTRSLKSNSCSPVRTPSPVDRMSSVVESVCSAGEGQASAVESLRSDMSWEAVEEGLSLLDREPTLWVPDHAVSRCTGCQTEFWLGRRKHHCRNCGRIFCADCSENSTPLPSEHLYNPVRVCSSCYSKLRTSNSTCLSATTSRDCGEILDHCKHNSAQTNNNPQIAASSN